MLKVSAYNFNFSIKLRMMNRRETRRPPVSRRFIKILRVNVDFSHRLMLRYIFCNLIQIGTFLYAFDL